MAFQGYDFGGRICKTGQMKTGPIHLDNLQRPTSHVESNGGKNLIDANLKEYQDPRVPGSYGVCSNKILGLKRNFF